MSNRRPIVQYKFRATYGQASPTKVLPGSYPFHRSFWPKRASIKWINFTPESHLWLNSLSCKLVFCCNNCLDLSGENVFQGWFTCLPSSWEQEQCWEKVVKFVTFSRHCSCSRELGKQVTHAGKKLFSRQI